jgi:hypothetical protein
MLRESTAADSSSVSMGPPPSAPSALPPPAEAAAASASAAACISRSLAASASISCTRFFIAAISWIAETGSGEWRHAPREWGTDRVLVLAVERVDGLLGERGGRRVGFGHGVL